MLRNFFSDSKMIYDSLIDDESKMIFENRIMYSMTKDPAYIINIVKMLNEGRALCEILDNFDGCYVWGAGAWGRELVKIYQDKIKGIIDNNEKKWETNIYGTVVMSPKKALGDINDEKILISSRLYYKEIYNEIIDYGVSSEQIINVGKVLDKMAERQYFDIPDLQYNENDVFLDVGSLDGMTASRYVEKSTNKFSKIYCFEPDYKNIPAVRKKVTNYGDRCEVIEKGAWSKDDVLLFKSMGNGSSSFGEKDGISTVIEVFVTTIDSVLNGGRADFIKMDIEGAELEAIKGAKNTIQKYHPQLAISVYHKTEDILELPKLILEYNPRYKLYLRHYSITDSETVLYAIDNAV